VPDTPPVELAKATGAGVEAPERHEASGS